MQRLRGFPRRFRLPWRSAARISRDVEDELAFHLAAKTEALQREGLNLDEARAEALRQFGDLDGARERLVADDRRGERRTVRLMKLEDFARDTRIAWRSLWRTPGFTFVAILVLGLGIGVVSGGFALVNVMALKPALMDEPERVLGVFAVHPENGRGRRFSYSEYGELRERIETLSSLAAHEIIDAGVEEGAVTRRVRAAFVSANYFETLGVPVAQGRGFTRAEEHGDEPAGAVVSHDFWVRNGMDPGLLGSVVRVNGEPLVVVGIAARRFTGTMALLAVDVWMPLAAMERIDLSEEGEAGSLRDPQRRALLLFGRLEDGISADEAESELASLAARVDANLPDGDGDRYTYTAGEMGRTSYGSAPNPDGALGNDELAPFVLSSVVLLIACLNLANMFLARGANRRTEMAIRQSLGSGRARLVRMLLTESLLLAMLGGAVGLILAYSATSWIAVSFTGAVPGNWTILVDMRPDVRVLLVTVMTCFAATLLFGLGPAWRVTGADVLSGLKEGAGAIALGRCRPLASLSGRSLMIVAQLALSLLMLAAGGLFVRSALVAASATPSFSLDSTLLVELDPSLAGYDEARSRAVYVDIMERLRALPEVESGGMASLVPLSGISHSSSVQRAGLPPGENSAYALNVVISDGYFDALRLSILRGRDFTPAEVASERGPRVAIIDEPVARRLFPDDDALGRRIQFASYGPDVGPTVMEVVGIAPGTPGPEFDPAPRPHVYVPFGQAYTSAMHVVIGVDERLGDAAAVLETARNEIREIDPALPVLSLTTMRELRDANWSLWLVQLGGRVFTLLGALALFLAMVGLYGVRAFLVSQRTREIGVRMALGATRGDVIRQMMRESMALTAAGLGVGLLLALAAGQVLSSMLYEVSATDPWVLIGASACLALAAAVASWLPVRRALRIEPSAALRHE